MDQVQSVAVMIRAYLRCEEEMFSKMDSYCIIISVGHGCLCHRWAKFSWQISLEKLLRVHDFSMSPNLYLLIVEWLLHFTFIKSLLTFVFSNYSKIGAFFEFMGFMGHPSESSINQLLISSSNQPLMYSKTFYVKLSSVTKAQEMSYSDNLLSTPLDDEECQNSEEVEDSTWLISLASKEHIKIYPGFIEDQIHHQKKFEIRFPYIRIAEWITHLSTGSILIRPPADSDDSWTGIALYVVVKIHEHDHFEKSWELKEPHFHFSTSENTIAFQNLKGCSPGSYGLCTYVPREWFAGQFKKATSLEASVSANRPDVEVVRCGIHIISEQDTSLFATDLTRTASEHLKDFVVCQYCKQSIR